MSFFTWHNLQILFKIRADPFFQFPDNWSHSLYKHGFNFRTGNKINMKLVFGQFPGGHFPNGLFPDQQFPKDSSPKVSSPNEQFPERIFPRITVPRMTIPQREIHPNGYFPESRILFSGVKKWLICTK